MFIKCKLMGFHCSRYRRHCTNQGSPPGQLVAVCAVSGMLGASCVVQPFDLPTPSYIYVQNRRLIMMCLYHLNLTWTNVTTHGEPAASAAYFLYIIYLLFNSYKQRRSGGRDLRTRRSARSARKVAGTTSPTSLARFRGSGPSRP